MKFVALFSVGIVLAIVALSASPATASRSDAKIFESAIVGLPEGMTGTGGTIRTVAAAGAPWVADGRIRLGESGRMRVDIEGLVLAGSFTTGSVTGVRASLTCEGTDVVATTAVVPLSARGDASIDKVTTLPTSCVGPIVLIRIGTATTTGPWIAATGFISTPRIRVDPFAFDPGHTRIIRADWVRGLGLQDDHGDKREGLLLSKAGNTAAFAAGGAVVKGVRGMTIARLGFDFRAGGHCGAGAPRFNAVVDMDGNLATMDSKLFFFGCAHGTQSSVPGVTPAADWRRVRFADEDAFPQDGVSTWPGFGHAVLRELEIVFDEGTDAGPDNTGMVVLDNVFVNLRYVTNHRGAASPEGKELDTRLIGIPTAGMTFRAVAGGGFPWVADGRIKFGPDGRLRANVNGLLFATGPFIGTTGPVTGVRASLTCAGTNVVASTGVAPLRTDGDARIRVRVPEPVSCIGPVILIRVGATTSMPTPTLGPWIAASGFAG